jgi:hypothetical protein
MSMRDVQRSPGGSGREKAPSRWHDNQCAEQNRRSSARA